MTDADWLTVPRGQLTFDAEGTDEPGSRYFSRRVHWPGGASGVTIGRGFDMRHRNSHDIREALRAAGVPLADLYYLGRGSGLYGTEARIWCGQAPQEAFVLSLEAQHRLFLATYDELASDTDRILRKADVLAAYGRAPAWDRLPPMARDILVDLRYRGDFTPRTRKTVMPPVVSGDMEALAAVMADRDLWADVPADRWRRRAQYLGGAE